MQQLLIYMISAAIGAVLTFYIQKFGISSVVASCIIGLMGALLSTFLKMPELAAVIFTGSFVGMTDLSIGSLPKITVAGSLSGLLFGMSAKLFEGYGGRLGTIAFVSLVICLGVFYIVGNRFKGLWK